MGTTYFSTTYSLNMTLHQSWRLSLDVHIHAHMSCLPWYLFESSTLLTLSLPCSSMAPGPHSRIRKPITPTGTDWKSLIYGHIKMLFILVLFALTMSLAFLNNLKDIENSLQGINTTWTGSTNISTSNIEIRQRLKLHAVTGCQPHIVSYVMIDSTWCLDRMNSHCSLIHLEAYITSDCRKGHFHIAFCTMRLTMFDFAPDVCLELFQDRHDLRANCHTEPLCPSSVLYQCNTLTLNVMFHAVA